MLFFLLIILYILILVLELPFLFKNKLYREIAVFLVIWAAGIYLSMAKFRGTLATNPLEPLFYLYKPKI